MKIYPSVLKKDGWILYYLSEEAKATEEDFVAQYNMKTFKLLNFWGTIEIQLGINANVPETIEIMLGFENAIRNQLA